MKKNIGTERTEVFLFGEAWGFSTNFIAEPKTGEMLDLFDFESGGKAMRWV